MWGGERLAGALDDRVHRPGRDLDPEQLPGELGRVTTRHAVAHRERDDRCLEQRPERQPRLGGRLGRGHGRALRAAHPVQPMLAHPYRDRRQLRQLMPRRLLHVDEFARAELALTRSAAIGPMLDDLIHELGRKQLERLPDLVSRRRYLAARYATLLGNIEGLSLPVEPELAQSNWQSYCVRLPARLDQKAVMQSLLDQGISTRRGIMCAHRERPYANPKPANDLAPPIPIWSPFGSEYDQVWPWPM